MNGATPPRLVVFDFDGTLIDSLTLVLEAIAHAIEPFGRERPTRAIFAHLGGPPERFLPTFLNDLSHLPTAMARLESYHRQNTHLIRPFEGVAALLDELRAQGVLTAIWTGRDRVSCEWLLSEHGLRERFATVVCGDDLPTHKPDPEGLRQIMRRLAVTPAQTLFVGDAAVDVLGGAACGVDTILIRHDRQVEAHITARTWQTALTPADAFRLVLTRLGRPG